MYSYKNIRSLGQHAIFARKPKQPQPRDATNDVILQPEEDARELIAVASNAQELLLEVKSVFPLMLFPDTLKIDRQKVILVHKTFWGVQRIINIQISDLQAIEADVGPFFGSISIIADQSTKATNRIYFLSRKDTLRAQSLLQGFVIANKREIDCTSIEKDELTDLLVELGQGNTHQ